MTSEPPVPAQQSGPYITLNLVVPISGIARIPSNNVGAWGERIRNPGEPARSFVVAIWGQQFECTETLEELDSLMGFTPVVHA